jgi:hypothetical protein
MEGPLKSWLSDAIGVNAIGIAQDYDSACRRMVPLSQRAPYGVEAIWVELQSTGELFQFLDFIVYDASLEDSWVEVHKIMWLMNILEQNGSAWTVGIRGGVSGLEKRVPEGVAVAVSEVAAEPGHAGRLISAAWHAAFGREPDYEKAYAQAVKAVEAAAIPVVKPGDRKATLGTVIAQMRADDDWSYPTDREHGAAKPSDVLLSMLQSLWTGQNDRHAGQPDYSPTSRGAAEAAVVMAVTLVQWFTSKAITRP